MYLNEKKIFTKAFVESQGDPSVGIASHRIRVEDIHLDLAAFAEEENRFKAIRDVLNSLLQLGEVIIGTEPMIACVSNGLGSWVLSSVNRSEPIWFRDAEDK